MSKVKRFSLEERDNDQYPKVIYDKENDEDIKLNNIFTIIDLFNQLDEQIADLQHRLEVAEKATKLACEEMDDSGCIAICNYCPYNLQEECPNECPQSTEVLEKYFKDQAEKEIERRVGYGEK